jgi:hypothetical protein
MNTPDSFHFDCPFCGRDVHVVSDASKHFSAMPGHPLPPLEAAPAITHREPACRKFRVLDATSYLAEARKAILASGPS